MDTPLLDHKWFWGPNTDHMLKPLAQLMHVYVNSVGRGCVLLLNATPDTSGLIPASHMQRYTELGAAVRRFSTEPKGETRGQSAHLELRWNKPTTVSHVVMQEDIREGHTVRAFVVEGLTGGQWRLLAGAASMGYKRIECFAPVTVDALRLRITERVATPSILQFAAYWADPVGSGLAAGGVAR